MDDWKTSVEFSLLKTEKFFSHINKKDNTDAYYMHAETVRKDFKI